MLDVGDKAPEFNLVREDGQVLTLKDLLQEGPIAPHLKQFRPKAEWSACLACPGLV